MKLSNQVRMWLCGIAVFVLIIALGWQDGKKVVESYATEGEFWVYKIESYNRQVIEGKADELRSQGWEVRETKSPRDPRQGYEPYPRHSFEARKASLPSV